MTTFVTFSTDGSRLWGMTSGTPTGPWLHVGETHCRDLMERGIGTPVGQIAERIAESISYQRQRDEIAARLRADGCAPHTAIHRARAELAERGINRPADAPVWL